MQTTLQNLHKVCNIKSNLSGTYLITHICNLQYKKEMCVIFQLGSSK